MTTTQEQPSWKKRTLMRRRPQNFEGVDWLPKVRWDGKVKKVIKEAEQGCQTLSKIKQSIGYE